MSGPVHVAILYPREWYGSAEGFADAVRRLEAIDPRVVVDVVGYDESHDRRTARSLGTAPDELPAAPALTDAQTEVLAACEAVLAIDLPLDVVERAPHLRWVQAVGAGTGQLQDCGLAAAGIRLTSNGGANSIAIAEFALGRLLAHAKRFGALAEAQAARAWRPVFGDQLAGTTLGLIGYGPINRAVAWRAAAFGMEVLVTRSSTGVPAEPPVGHFFGPGELHEMLGRSDAVIAAAPETPATTGMLDADALAAMKPGAFLVNVGRGSLIDEAALIAALRAGQVGAAALDVTVVEPLPADDPLRDAPNLELSSHCSASPAAMFPNVHRQFEENLRRYLHDEPLQNEVEADRGY